jgi:hypothetical protein
MKIEQLQWSVKTGWIPAPTSCGLGESAQVVFLFGSVNLLKSSQAFDLCHEVYPNAHLLGCSTAGEIQGTVVSLETVAVTALSFDHTPLVVTRVQLRDPGESFEAGRKLIRSLNADGLKHVFVISEVLQVDASDVIEGINAALPAGVTVSGGFSADGDRQQVSHIWCDGAPEQSSIAALGLYGNHLKVGSAATGVWGQFGPIRRITKSKGSVLYELDGRSALGLYKEYLGELAAGLPASGLLFPVCLSVRDTGRCVLRGLLSVDEATQSMRFAGNMPEGATVRMMMGSIERLIDDTLVAAEQSKTPLEGTPTELAFVVSCNGRRHVLKQRVEEEIEAVREVLGEQAILTGFYSCGEIAPLAPGQPSELHNEALAITTFAEV